ncbi:MAG: serine hydrolase [Chloroflexi bacterium]|nr:serine hydrolase [Chloroflexota bacterium]
MPKRPRHKNTIGFDLPRSWPSSEMRGPRRPSPALDPGGLLPWRRAAQWLSVALLAAALAILGWQLVIYAAAPGTLPPQALFGGLPAGGLTPAQAAEQLRARYATPVQLVYGGQSLQLDPAQVGFRLQTESMLAELAEGALRDFLLEEAARYDSPPRPPRPGLRDLTIHPGEPGRVLDVEASLPRVEAALLDPEGRSATLAIEETPAPPATLDTLAGVIQQYTLIRPFRGFLGLTVVDLQTGEELHLNLVDGERIRTRPDVAVAATSAVKALIMLEFYRERPDGLYPWEATEMKNIVEASSNTSADNLMSWIGDGCWECAFRTITQTGRTIGMENTFVAGIYYAAGVYEFQLAPPGIATPANQATDFTTHPDPYFQTTTADLAKLYTALYRCSKENGGLLTLFPGEVSKRSCEELIGWLEQVVDPLIIKKGVPDGTPVAHKHGFTTFVEGATGPDTVGDAGIVYTPGGDFVVSAFTYRAQDPSWDEFTSVIGDVARAAYNYFNPPAPIR